MHTQPKDLKTHPGINDDETLTHKNPVACTSCNGVLASAMMKACTPEQIAHLYVHSQSNVDHLLKALHGMLDFFEPSARRSRACEAARAAIAKVRG